MLDTLRCVILNDVETLTLLHFLFSKKKRKRIGKERKKKKKEPFYSSGEAV